MGYYDNIEDLPLKNWRKITEKGDLTFTRKDISKGTVKEDIAHDELIQNSYIEEFGFTKEYLRIQEIRTDIALLECDMVIEDDNFLKNRIKRLKRELEELQVRNVGGDFDECIHYIEVWRKIEVDEDTMSTKKFFKLVRTYQKEIAERKKAS